MTKRIIALAIILLATACENPVDHFTEDRSEPRKIVVPQECLSTPDSIVVDSLGRETTNWSCQIGK